MSEKLSILSLSLSVFNVLIIPVSIMGFLSGVVFVQELLMYFLIKFYFLFLILGVVLSSMSFSNFRKENLGKKWIVYTSLILSLLLFIAIIVMVIIVLIGYAGAMKSFF